VHFFLSTQSSIRCIFTRHGTYLLNSPTHYHTSFIAQVFSIRSGSGTELIFQLSIRSIKVPSWFSAWWKVVPLAWRISESDQ
jgi:hypothetical protein